MENYKEQLGGYTIMRKEGDWEKGIEYCLEKKGEDKEIIEKAKKLLEKIIRTGRKNTLSGRSRVGIATALYYIISVLLGKKVTQRHISESFNSTTTTLRNTCNIILMSEGMDTDTIYRINKLRRDGYHRKAQKLMEKGLR